MFAPQTYAERRQRLLASLKAQGLSGLALFLGNGESPMNYADNTYPFRQDSRSEERRVGKECRL